MVKSNKEILYWSALISYGVTLLLLLLYLRFPAERFREFCERYVENMLPAVSCSILRVGYAFPTRIRFENIELKDATTRNEMLYSDSLITVTPFWQKPFTVFDVRSAAFDGTHTFRLQLNESNRTVEILALHIDNVALANIETLTSIVDRKVSGNLEIVGSLKLSKEPLQLVEAEGFMSISNGEIELKRSILQQKNIGLKELKVNFFLRNNELELTDGSIQGTKLDATFRGKFALSVPLQSAMMSLSGEFEPRNLLFQKNKQLKAVVTRMQKKYGQTTLPFNVSGTLGRPTFIFR